MTKGFCSTFKSGCILSISGKLKEMGYNKKRTIFSKTLDDCTLLLSSFCWYYGNDQYDLVFQIDIFFPEIAQILELDFANDPISLGRGVGSWSFHLSELNNDKKFASIDEFEQLGKKVEQAVVDNLCKAETLINIDNYFAAVFPDFFTRPAYRFGNRDSWICAAFRVAQLRGIQDEQAREGFSLLYREFEEYKAALATEGWVDGKQKYGTDILAKKCAWYTKKFNLISAYFKIPIEDIIQQ
jgi:hypothetical protein